MEVGTSVKFDYWRAKQPELLAQMQPRLRIADPCCCLGIQIYIFSCMKHLVKAAHFQPKLKLQKMEVLISGDLTLQIIVF